MHEFEVIHPFHPRFGKRFALISHWRNWGDDRVVYENHEGHVRSLPTAWTSLAGADPFVRVSAGRSFFRTEDLVALVSLIRSLARSEACKGDSAVDVSTNTPTASQDVQTGSGDSTVHITE